MIATGGLLRINARRQDSLRSKTRAENRRKRKAKRKRRSEVVVVQGKLQLCSISGLVAAVGVAILLVGVAMAILGYWPRDSLLYPETAKVALSGGEELMNSSLVVTGTNDTDSVQAPRSFLEEFLHRHLHSDLMKVLGPLIMGIGIFLFICANAVLHENRDKETKIINLRDIYSTVIDVHSLRSKDCSPLNGFVNYVQSKGMEAKSSAAYTAALLARTSWPSGGASYGGGQEEGGEGQGPPTQSSGTRLGGAEKPPFTDTVYSICQDHKLAPQSPPDQPPLSPPHSSVSPPTSSSSLHWDTAPSSGHFFTLPLTRSLNRSGQQHQRRPSVRAEAGRGRSRSSLGGDGVEGGGKVQTWRTQDWVEVSRSSCSLQGAPQGSQAQLLPSSPDHTFRPTASHLSLSASPPSSRAVDHSRRLSCPRLDSYGCPGYTKLGSMQGESFESSEVAAFSHMTSEDTMDRGQRLVGANEEEETQEGSEAFEETGSRRYSNKEKLLMISHADSGLDQSQEMGRGLGQEGEGPVT